MKEKKTMKRKIWEKDRYTKNQAAIKRGFWEWESVRKREREKESERLSKKKTCWRIINYVNLIKKKSLTKGTNKCKMKRPLFAEISIFSFTINNSQNPCKLPEPIKHALLFL